jgi:hypothetical protein
MNGSYGGRFYSYADQFLRDLPVAEGILDTRRGGTRRLSRIAESLTGFAARRNQLREKLESFPTSFEPDLARYELDTVSKLAREHPSSAQLSIEMDSISVEKALYGYEVRYGSQRPFEFEHREHAECLAEAFRTRGRKTLPLKEVLAWRVPVKPEGCRKVLELQEQTRRELSRLRERIVSLEGELNDLVYDLYGVTAEERKVIEDFLDRYSSQSAAEIAESDPPPED